MNPYQSPPICDETDPPWKCLASALLMLSWIVPVVVAYIAVMLALYPAVVVGFLAAPIFGLGYDGKFSKGWWPVVPGSIAGAILLPSWWQYGLLPAVFDFCRKANLFWNGEQ